MLIGQRRAAVLGRRRAPAPPPAPAGFVRNGASNATLRAMLSRVKTGAGRGKIILIGDSTTASQGAGTGSYNLTNARANRVANVMAAELRAAGYAARDGSVVVDNAVRFAGVGLATYDPRMSGSITVGADDNAIARGFLKPGGSAAIFTPDETVDTFECLIAGYTTNSVTFQIDGAAPATMSINGVAQAAGASSVAQSGATPLQRVVMSASSAGTHALSYTGGANCGIISLTAYNSATAAIDIKSHAGLGLITTAAVNSGSFYTLGVETFEAADLYVINLGTNDMIQGTIAGNVAGYKSAWLTALGTLVDTCKAVGDVLLVFPYAFNNVADVTTADWNGAAKTLAASKSVSLQSLYDYFGPSTATFQSTRTVDGGHGNAGLYAEIASIERQAILAMAG